MKTTKPQVHPAVDSNGAAKANGAVKLDPPMVGILQSLLAERQAAEEKIAYFLGQCAERKGIKLEEFNVRLDVMAFVPKPPPAAPKVIVQ